MAFSDVLKELRKECGCTARTLSASINCSINIIYDWEKGRCEPSYMTLSKIADYFNVSTDYLLGREDELGNVATSTAPNLTTQEQALLVAFRKLDDRRKELIVEDTEYYAKKKQKV